MNPELLPVALLYSLITGHPDAWRLKAYADSARVPRVVAWALAWQESRNNMHTGVRGAAGEWGRLQIMAATARATCPALDITTYEGNVKCGLRYLRRHFDQRGSWELAVRAYQCPTCRHRTDYERSVMETVGRFTARLHGAIP